MNQILLVEGNDDLHVISALCVKFNIPQNFKIIDTKGIDKLLGQVPVRMKQTGIKTIGIIIDADVNLAGRWQQVLKVVGQKMPNFPDEPVMSGTVHQENNLRVGVWIMPNNQLNGMLESFIEFLIPDSDELLPIVNTHLDAIEGNKINQYKLIHRDKAVIHSWLAVQEDPGTPMGLSITKKYLSTDVEQCKVLIDWLLKLFNKPANEG